MIEKLTEKEMMDAILKMCLFCIGPEGSLESSSKNYIFNDDLKMSSEYFSIIGIFKGFADRHLEGTQGNINYSTAYNIGDKVVRMVIDRIVQRNTTIDQTLGKYLCTEDVEFAIEKTKDLFVQAKGRFSSILVTNLIDLVELPSIRIGRVGINKLDNRYLHRFPENIPIKRVTLLSLKDSIPRVEFLEKNKNNVTFEISIKGWHFNDEASVVVEHSIEEFKRVLAYLYMCEHYLKRVEGEKFEIKTKEFQTYDFAFSGFTQVNKFFIIKIDQESKFAEVDNDINLSKKQFVIDAATVEKIKSNCCLEQFNKLGDEIKGKIANRVFTAFSWFLKGIHETDITDRAISLFISLESLLSVSSSTDSLAENVALLGGGNVEYKYKTRNKFKKTYALRNRIMHNGGIISTKEDRQHVSYLLDNVVWSLRNVLVYIDRILSCSNDGDDPIKVFFEKLKLGNI